MKNLKSPNSKIQTSYENHKVQVNHQYDRRKHRREKGSQNGFSVGNMFRDALLLGYLWGLEFCAAQLILAIKEYN